jgi:FKBP-type peptidyl-prolyl cis-trans isomerase FkpA
MRAERELMKIDGLTARSRWGVVAFVALLSGCGEDPVGVEFQVIEEVTFAASLNIDLSSMERLANGVYREDLVVGSGEALVFGMTATVTFTGWLIDGSQFDTGTFTFLMGNNQVIRGFEDGILGMLVGGTRRIIIPPNLGYGAQARGSIPPGSILIFEITLDEVTGPA